MEETPTPTPRENSLKNLCPPWRKGQSGNKNGRPKGVQSRGAILRMFAGVEISKIPYLAAKFPELAALNVTLEEAVNMKLVEASLEKEVAAIREIQDTLYGKIKEKHELTGADGEPLLPVMVMNDVPRE